MVLRLTCLFAYNQRDAYIGANRLAIRLSLKRYLFALQYRLEDYQNFPDCVSLRRFNGQRQGAIPPNLY